MTGIEFSIPLSRDRQPRGRHQAVRCSSTAAGTTTRRTSFPATGILDGNLGGNGFGGFTGDLSGVNMTDFAGDQFVTVRQPAVAAAAGVPEPAAADAGGAAALAVGERRRRRR